MKKILLLSIVLITLFTFVGCTYEPIPTPKPEPEPEVEPEIEGERVTTFAELSAALANADVPVVVLDADITAGATDAIKITKDVTLNLNGHTLTFSAKRNTDLATKIKGALIVNKDKTFTLEGDGEITGAGDYLIGVVGTFIMNGGKITGEEGKNNQIFTNGGKMIINDGLIEAPSKTYGLFLKNGSETEINGGKINTQYPIYVNGLDTTKNIIKINGGEIVGNSYLPAATTMCMISGGKFSANGSPILMKGGSLIISGGEFCNNIESPEKPFDYATYASGSSLVSVVADIQCETTTYPGQPGLVITGGTFKNGVVCVLDPDPKNSGKTISCTCTLPEVTVTNLTSDGLKYSKGFKFTDAAGKENTAKAWFLTEEKYNAFTAENIESINASGTIASWTITEIF